VGNLLRSPGVLLSALTLAKAVHLALAPVAWSRCIGNGSAVFLGADLRADSGGHRGMANSVVTMTTRSWQDIGAILLSAVMYAYNLILQRQQAILAKPFEIAFFQNGTVVFIYLLFAPFFS
jgi:hypothetical protein